MDSQTRSEYESLLQEDWVKLGYQPDDLGLKSQPDDPGLKSELHPLFQRTNASRPSGAEHIWPQYKSEGEYETLCAELGIVFQTASNMLETPASLDFLYQVAHNPRKISQQGPSNQGRPCKEFGWSEPPFTGRQMTKIALRRLSRSLTFTISDPNAILTPILLSEALSR